MMRKYPLRPHKGNLVPYNPNEWIIGFNGNARQRRTARRAYSKKYKIIKIQALLEGNKHVQHVYINYRNWDTYNL